MWKEEKQQNLNSHFFLKEKKIPTNERNEPILKKYFFLFHHFMVSVEPFFFSFFFFFTYTIYMFRVCVARTVSCICVVKSMRRRKHGHRNAGINKSFNPVRLYCVPICVRRLLAHSPCECTGLSVRRIYRLLTPERLHAACGRVVCVCE